MALGISFYPPELNDLPWRERDSILKAAGQRARTYGTGGRPPCARIHSPAVPAGRASRLWRPHLTKQLLARLVEAHHRILRVVGQLVDGDHVLHEPHVFGVGQGWDAPGLDDPGPNGVFFNACRTVWGLTVAIRPRATNSSASRHSVQRQRPCGGSLQATRINSCSTSPLIFTLSGRGGWGRGLTAASIPWVTKCWRTRLMVGRLTLGILTGFIFGLLVAALLCLAASIVAFNDTNSNPLANGHVGALVFVNAVLMIVILGLLMLQMGWTARRLRKAVQEGMLERGIQPPIAGPAAGI